MDWFIFYLIGGFVVVGIIVFVVYRILRRILKRFWSTFKVVEISVDDKRRLDLIELGSYIKTAEKEAENRGKDNAFKDYRH